MEFIYQLINNDPVLLLFLVLGVGYMVAKLRIGSFQLGSVAGVLLAGLLFGNFGFKANAALQSFGFVLFMFSVGYQAGPKFFEAVKMDGRRYLAISVIVSSTGFLLAYGISRYFNFDPGVSAGVLAGSLTSTPTLAAADAAVQSADYVAPNGFSREIVRNNITTAYAITYIFGLVGLILIIRMLPKLLKINLVEEARILKQKEEGSKMQPLFSPSDLVVRAFRVESEELTGITLNKLYDRANLNITIQKIIRDGETIDPKSDTMLVEGDLVSVIGILDDKTIKTFENKTFGPLVRNRELLHFEPETARISVTRKEIRGTKLGDLKIPLTYASFVSKISRLGVAIDVNENTVLEVGDVLDVSGPSKGLDMLGSKLGHVEHEVEQTDLQTFSWSIVIGILLGTITLSVAGITIGLGSAGGLLGIGLLVGYLRSVLPVFGRVPAGAQWIFNELGLLLFMAGVGLRGGDGLIVTLQSSGLELLFSGVLVTTTPLFVAYFFGRRLLKMNPLILLGAVIGAMTSGGALSVLNDESKSTIASVGYTGAYAFANILLTLAGALIMMM